jgi:uncharacterized protein
MSRPHGVHAGVTAGNSVDASICAHSGTTVERRFTAADLPRLREAGALEGSQVTARFAFSRFEGRVAIDGELHGALVLPCQRCTKFFELPVKEQFRLIVVREVDELDQEPGGYEAILADPARLDLQVLAEDQALLALPLVPRHAAEDCGGESVKAEPAVVEKGEPTQKPFGNLRDLMRKR